MATLKEIDPLLYGLIGTNDFKSRHSSSGSSTQTPMSIAKEMRVDFETAERAVNLSWSRKFQGMSPQEIIERVLK